MGLTIEFEKVGGFDPVEFDKDCVAAVRNAAERMGYSHRDLISGAGHDACWINRVAPTAMVMCPCVDGLSHNEAEEISREWAEAGANVLMQAVVENRGDCRMRPTLSLPQGTLRVVTTNNFRAAPEIRSRWL